MVPPVIACRIDSEQRAISRTVIKPHYSFFILWVPETQWPTLKAAWRRYDRRLSYSFSSTLPLRLHRLFTCLLNLSSFLFAVCFSQSGLIFSVPLPFQSLTLLQKLHFLHHNPPRPLRRCRNLVLIVPHIFDFHAHYLFRLPLVKIAAL